MDGWWSEIDREVRDCLVRHGAMSPAELGRHLRLSESAAASLLALLAREGKVRIASVELPESGRDPRAVA
jgi:hypothetical protein